MKKTLKQLEDEMKASVSPEDPNYELKTWVNERVAKMEEVALGTKGDTPVKGVDYFTQAEINSIIKYAQSKVKDGARGPKGEDGKTPVRGVDYQRDGRDGARGPKGEDGKTPVKGVDYFTKEDKIAFLTYILKNIKIPKDGVSPSVDEVAIKVATEMAKRSGTKDDDFVTIKQLVDFLRRGGFRGGGGSTTTTGGGSPLANEFNYIISRSGANTVAYDVANSTILSTNTNAKIVFQAAVDAANDGVTTFGGLIGVKAGTYLIDTGEVNMRSNVHIVGAGEETTIIQSNTISGAAFRKIGTTVATNFSLSGMTIDCLSLQDTTAFLGEYIEDVTFRNLKVKNVGNVSGTRGFGIQIGVYTPVPVTAGSFVVGQGYEIVSLGTTDFTAIGATSNNLYVKFIATGAGTGTGVANINASTDHEFRNFNINIENCSFDNFYSTNEEILLLNTKGVRISGCDFGENAVGQGPGIGIFQWAEDVEVTSCTFNDINGPSIYYSLSCNRIDIHDNFFYGVQQGIMGAALSDSDKSPVAFDVHKVYGLRVAGNYFKNNTSGVQIGSTDGAIIDGNVFEELENMPILINYGTTVDTLALDTRTLATNFKITNNVFKNNNQEAEDFLANTGMLFNGADGDFYGEISGNTFYDSNEGVIITAGDFVIGRRYTIETLGTTDFTLIGAAYNIVGITFTATGAGTGTGTAIITTQRSCITFEGYYLTPAGAFNIGSVYGILPTGFGEIIQNATTISVDSTYTIVSLGTTDFTLIGAPSNTVGVTFTATGQGTGTGTVTPDTDYTTIGAANNDIGTVFTATGKGYGVGRAMEGTGSATATTLVAGTYYAIMTIGNTDFTLAGANNKYTAGDFKIGRTYEIFTVGTTDFTLIGASSNTVGVTFTATGVGSGTGTAVTIGDIFMASGSTIGTGTVLVVKRLNFNRLVIKDNRLQSNGTLVNEPIQILNGAILGENVVNKNNWNVNPDNFYAHGNVSGTVEVNRKDGAIQHFRLTDDINISIANGISKGDKLTTMLKQGSIGGYTATWDSTNITWASGIAPVLQTVADLTETFEHVWDGSYWVEVGASSKIRQSNDTFTITSPDTPTTAGSFVVGERYTIDSVGTTDFTLIGASSNTVGVTFTATNGSPQIASSLVAGRRYVIQFVGSTDFTLIGAASNTIGVAFTATGAGAGSGLAYIDGRGIGTGVGLLQYTRLYTLDPETATTLQTARFLATITDTLKTTKIIL